MSSSTSSRPINAKFPGDPNGSAEIVSDLRQIVNNAKKSPDWDTELHTQAAINALSADADSIEQAELQIDQLRKQILQLEEKQAAQIIVGKQHRKHAEGAVTVASKGSPVAVKAWGCLVAERTPSTPTDEAPQNVSARNTRSPGDVVVQCKGTRAKAYVFQRSEDATFPVGSSVQVVTTSATNTMTGLPAGRKVYFRVAAVRALTGQSKWSETVPLTVR